MKLFVITFLFSALMLNANNHDKIITDYITAGLAKYSELKDVQVKIISKEPIHDKKEWSAYIINVSGKEVTKEGEETFTHNSFYFTDGSVVTKDLRNVESHERYKETISPKIRKNHYTENNYLFGNKDAKHKVAIFSDPLCPYCIKYIPQILDTLKKQPSEYSVYYYHLPLGMHPASKTLVKAYIVLEQKNSPKLNMNKLYDVEIAASELNEQIILNAFNKVFNTKVTVEDISTKSVLNHYDENLKISTDLMVRGTPSLFYDGKKDSIGRFLK